MHVEVSSGCVFDLIKESACQALCREKRIPYWYLISRFWRKKYFAGFYFRDFNKQI